MIEQIIKMSFLQPAPEPATPLGRLRPLSSSASIRVSPLQLGGRSIGESWSSFMGSMSKPKAFELLDAYVDAGGNCIDTSNNYQDEQSERWIGEWMKARGNRDNVVIATKYTTSYRDYELGKVSYLKARESEGEALRAIGPATQSAEEARMSEALEKVAAEHGVDSVTAIALAYVLSKSPYVFPIIGGRKIEHLQDNLKALEIRLTEAQIEYLESVKPLDVGYPANYIGQDPRITGKASGVLATTGPLAFVKYPSPIKPSL
ncbi:hypothetical protein APSETT445_005000 [Aspergillus pseudonomiae]